jgi:aryl-alcohol dehydrogenase-like predicted oxidoreductase
MEYRQLGQSGLMVSVLSLGTMILWCAPGKCGTSGRQTIPDGI